GAGAQPLPVPLGAWVGAARLSVRVHTALRGLARVGGAAVPVVAVRGRAPYARRSRGITEIGRGAGVPVVAGGAGARIVTASCRRIARIGGAGIRVVAAPRR